MKNAIDIETEALPNEGFKPCQVEKGRWIREVRKAIESMEYGDVTISVHQNKVVQVQKTAKIRF